MQQNLKCIACEKGLIRAVQHQRFLPTCIITQFALYPQLSALILNFSDPRGFVFVALANLVTAGRGERLILRDPR